MDVVNRVFEILRYRPGQDAEPMYQTYEVPCLPDWVVLDALNAIRTTSIPRSRTAGPAAWVCTAAAG